MAEEKPHGGEMKWVPYGAYIVYPLDYVVHLFGHEMASSTRSMMNKAGYSRQISGWPVEEVEFVLENRDPKMLENWRNRKLRPKTRRKT